MNTQSDSEAPLPHNDGAKTKRIDLGLAVLSALTPPQAALTPAEIAAWCGCTPSMITSIEARALRRLREKVCVQFNFSSSDQAGLRRWMALHFRS
jgi:hypothetical protein